MSLSKMTYREVTKTTIIPIIPKRLLRFWFYVISRWQTITKVTVSVIKLRLQNTFEC